MKSFWENEQLVRLVEVGEIIPGLAQLLQEGFDECLEKNSHRREVYYILYTAAWFACDTQLRQVFSPRAKKPPKMLNTICWKINNKKGTIKQLWVLPMDAPIQPIPTTPILAEIAEEAKGMPILY